MQNFKYEQPALERNNWCPKLTAEDFAEGSERSVAECDPQNYEVKYHGGAEPSADALEEILDGRYHEIKSGYVDWRKNEHGKYTIWLGRDHMTIYYDNINLPDDPKYNDYFLGIKVSADSDKKMRIPKDMLGQTCCRPDDHLQKAVDAADAALKSWVETLKV